jgi:glucose-1-phosphate thymidylyltransferase
MKGIILAGGTGSRLWPITASVSKQLLPVYDKPLIYYPLSTLLLAGIREVLVITRPEDRADFEKLLQDGRQFGINIVYAEQAKPSGIAEAFIIGKEFIGKDSVCLILGDNIFYGPGLGQQLSKLKSNEIATIFAFEVQDPERYGVVEFAKNGGVLSIEEKPIVPKSNYAIPGIYFYPNSVLEIAKNISPSPRGELEITDINLKYIDLGKLKCINLPRGTAWFDTGTIDSLNDAANFLRAIEQRQGLKVGCPEEVALTLGLVSPQRLSAFVSQYPNNEYRTYIERIISRVAGWLIVE